MMVQIGNVCLLVIFFAFDIGDFMEQERDSWAQADALRRELELERKQAKAREDAAEEERKRAKAHEEEENRRWCPHCQSWKPRANFGRHLTACSKTAKTQ